MTAYAGSYRPGFLQRMLTAELRWQRRKPTVRAKPITSEPVQSDIGPRNSDIPGGCIRLGIDRETRQYIDLQLNELANHVFIPGVSGSGKTTTLSRLADGVLAFGQGVIIVDCKGGDLKAVALSLARKHGVIFYLVDPDDPTSLGYDPCTGDGADVSNKLVGVFSYEGAAEIYKLAAMRVIPILVGAIRAAGKPLTLKALADALDSSAALRRYGRDAGPPYREQLDSLARLQTGVVAEGHTGLALRFEALLHGKFGPLFGVSTNERESLDWHTALAQPSVTYIALRATASSEDVDLMGRIIAQDLKQVCARRLQALTRGESLTPTLLIIDEFAALHEAEQFIDLLLQARQALMPTVLSTQHVPETVSIRNAALGAGLIIAHRLASEDAQLLSDQFGTRSSWLDTLQWGEEGATGMGSARPVDEFNIHPNLLRDMQLGHAALRSVACDRRCIVQIYPIEKYEVEQS
jgi:Type IV secretion-system coupling protein DNA-binding domain